MPHGTRSKASAGQCHHDISHIPVESEEIISTRKSTLAIRKTTSKEIWIALTAVGTYDGDYFDVASLTEQALQACLPKGSWVTRRSPFELEWELSPYGPFEKDR